MVLLIEVTLNLIACLEYNNYALEAKVTHNYGPSWLYTVHVILWITLYLGIVL